MDCAGNDSSLAFTEQAIAGAEMRSTKTRLALDLHTAFAHSAQRLICADLLTSVWQKTHSQSAADSRHNRYFHPGRNRRRQSTCVTHVLICHKNIHVHSNFAGFGQYSVTQSRICSEQHLQSFEQIGACFHIDPHVTPTLCEIAQRTRNIE